MSMRLLKSKMVEKDVSVEELSKTLNIHPATMYRKIASDGDNFTIKEAYSVIQHLELKGEEAISIFFEK